MEGCDPQDKGDLLGASLSGQRHRGGLGNVLESGRASTAPWLSEPPGSLALSLSTVFFPHLFIYSAKDFQVLPVGQALLWPWESAATKHRKIFAVIGAPILVCGGQAVNISQRRKSF